MLVAIGGFVAGYIVGAKAGKAGLAKLSESWQVIQASDEFKAAVSSAGAMASGFVKQRVSSNLGGTASSMVEGIMETLVNRNRLRVVS